MLNAMRITLSTPTYHRFIRIRTESSISVRLSRGKHVPPATNCMKQLAGMAFIDLAPKALDIDFDQVGEGVESFIPDVFGDLGTAHHSINMPGKVFQKRVFFAGKRNRASCTPHTPPLRFDRQIVKLYGFRSQDRSTPQKRPHTGEQLAQIKRLAEVVVSASI